jgi:hypothetical protein
MDDNVYGREIDTIFGTRCGELHQINGRSGPLERLMRVILIGCLAILVAVCMAAIIFWWTGSGRERIGGARARCTRRSSQ